jgi:hypothetical protein
MYCMLTGYDNLAFGYEALSVNTAGNRNVAIDTSALANILGSDNIGIGYGTLVLNVGNNNYNVAVGSKAGWSNNGSGNVFIGYSAGYNETGSNLLYIANTDTATPLIWGDFSGAILTINGRLGIGSTGPDRKLDILDASNPQLRLTHTDGTVYSEFQVDSSGHLNIALTGDEIVIPDAKNITVNTTTGTKIGTATTQKLGFFNATPVVQPTALTGQLTTITHTAPTPDYAIQNLTNSSGFGFVTADEGNTVLSVILNLQTRVGELETKLKALGFLA